VAERGRVLAGKQRAAFAPATDRSGLVIVCTSGATKRALPGVAREACESAGLAVRGAALCGIAAKGLAPGSGIAQSVGPA
jgi:hypothetical protein